MTDKVVGLDGKPLVPTVEGMAEQSVDTAVAGLLKAKTDKSIKGLMTFLFKDDGSFENSYTGDLNSAVVFLALSKTANAIMASSFNETHEVK